MEMGAPFTGSAGPRVPGLDNVAEVEEAPQLSVTQLGRLAQVDRVGEHAELGDGLGGHLSHPERGGLLELEDRYPGAGQEPERLRDVLEFHRLMQMSNTTPRCRRTSPA